MSTFPDLCVVVADNELIDELNTVVKLKDPEFLLSYDTTYVSPLVFKHTMFENNPIVAGMFMIHERKLQDTHDTFFRRLNLLVKNLKGMPIVTDMESAIVRSIREQTSLTQLGVGGICDRMFSVGLQKTTQEFIEQDISMICMKS